MPFVKNDIYRVDTGYMSLKMPVFTDKKISYVIVQLHKG